MTQAAAVAQHGLTVIAGGKSRKTWVSKTPSLSDVLPTLRILLREDRIDEAKDIIEFAYTRYPHAFR